MTLCRVLFNCAGQGWFNDTISCEYARVGSPKSDEDVDMLALARQKYWQIRTNFTTLPLYNCNLE